MIDPRLTDYISKRLSQGAAADEIKKVLIGSGWAPNNIDEALQQVNAAAASAVVSFASSVPATTEPIREQPTKAVEAKLTQTASALPLTPLALLKKAWNNYWQKAGFLIGFSFTVLSLIAIGVWLIVYWSSQKATPDLTVIIVGTVWLLVSLILAFWLQLSSLHVLMSSEKTSGGQSCKFGLSKLPAFWWVSLLNALALIGALIIFIIPGILVIIAATFLKYPELLPIAPQLIYGITMPVLVIMLVWFSQCILVLIKEENKGLDALLTSQAYVKNFWGNTLERITFISLILMPLTLLPYLLMLLSVKAGIALMFVIVVLTNPLVLSFKNEVFQDLRRLKASQDLSPRKGAKPFLISLIIIGAAAILVAFFLLIINFRSLFKEVSSSF